MNVTQFRGWLVILLIVIGFFAFSSRDYQPKHSIYNEGMYGASHLREKLESFNFFNLSRLLISPFSLTDNTNNISMMVIIGSERSYTQVEIDAYREYVEEGGVLLVFEDFGPARSVVETFGISYFPGVVRETNEQATVNRPTQFFVQDIITPLLLGINLTLFVMVNRAAAIRDPGLLTFQTLPLLVTLDSAYIDVDDDNEIDAKDRDIDGGIPIGLLKQYEKGLVVAISDASIPLNLYYNKQVEVGGLVFDVPNILWTSVLISSLAFYANTTTVIFDESHQELVLSSTAGVLNLLSSTWVGIINSQLPLSIFALGILAIGIMANRKVFQTSLKKLRGTYTRKIEVRRDYISHPSLAERSISEQYILYQRLNSGFLQVANASLLEQIKETGKADDFIRALEEEYGELSKGRQQKELLEIHRKIRDYVDENLSKWL